MRVLVTGGAGYVGSHICEQLAWNGHYAVAYDDLSTGDIHNVRRRRNVRFVRGGIGNTSLLSQTMVSEGIDAVIHCAAKSLVSESFLEPNEYMATNVMGTLSVMSAMRVAGIRHIVATSSCAVYGAASSYPITENTPVAPISPYGVSKLAMEGLLQTAAPDIVAVSLRCFNIAWAESCYSGRIGDTHLIPRLVQAAMGTAPRVTVFGTDYPTGDGTCVRDYTHVIDVATAHICALTWLQNERITCPTTFNLGSGVGTSVMEIVKACKASIPVPVEVDFGPKKAGDPAHLVANSYDICDTLGWYPRHTTLAEMIQSTWVSYGWARDK